MGRAYIKPDRVIVAEMMARGASTGIRGIGSGDPGPEIVGRAHRAVKHAIGIASREFKYQSPSYPFAPSDERGYRESFEVTATPRSVKITNNARGARFVELGREEVRAKTGRWLKLPLKESAYERMRARRKRTRTTGKRDPAILTRFQGRPYLLVKKVRAFDGYAIIFRALLISYSR